MLYFYHYLSGADGHFRANRAEINERKLREEYSLPMYKKPDGFQNMF